MYKPLTDWLKDHLGKQVEKVSVSNKLDDSPLYIFTSQYGYSARMEKINKAQAFANQEKAPSYMLAKKALEINPHHGVMKVLLERVKAASGTEEGVSADTKEYVDLLFQMALVNSGFSIDEPQSLTEPLEKLIRVGFGVPRDAPIEDIDIELESEENEEMQEEGQAEPAEES
jgi:HSP90 family molecular chaperone